MKQKASDAKENLSEESPTRTRHRKICGLRLKSDAPIYAAVPILGLFATQVTATVFMNSQVVFLLRASTTYVSED